MMAWAARASNGVQDVASFYRMRSWQTKVDGLRPVLYTLFGYAIAAQWHLGLLVANLMAVIGLLMFFGAYGQYWDWRLLGERNSTQGAIKHLRLPTRTGLWLSLAPVVAMVVLLRLTRALGGSALSEALLCVVAVLGIVYISPGIRLKGRRWGWLLPILGYSLLFLQAYTLHDAPLSPSVLLLFGLLMLFQCQSELLHLFDDALHSASEPTYMSQERLLAWLRRLPVVSCGASLIAACLNPVFLNTTVWSLVRFRALRGLSGTRVSQQRRQLWRPLWSLYEFVIYAALGFLHRVI